jgi:hypothetical protein
LTCSYGLQRLILHVHAPTPVTVWIYSDQSEWLVPPLRWAGGSRSSFPPAHPSGTMRGCAMKGIPTKPRFPVCRRCRVAPLLHVGWIWECPGCGLRITTAAVRHDDSRAGKAG